MRLVYVVWLQSLVHVSALSVVGSSDELRSFGFKKNRKNEDRLSRTAGTKQKATATNKKSITTTNTTNLLSQLERRPHPNN